MEDTGKPNNKKAYKRAVRRAKIASNQAKAYNKSTKSTDTWNKTESVKAQERIDSGPVPMGGNKAMMKSAARNVRRKDMSKQSKRANLRLYK